MLEQAQVEASVSLVVYEDIKATGCTNNSLVYLPGNLRPRHLCRCGGLLCFGKSRGRRRWLRRRRSGSAVRAGVFPCPRSGRRRGPCGSRIGGNARCLCCRGGAFLCLNQARVNGSRADGGNIAVRLGWRLASFDMASISFLMSATSECTASRAPSSRAASSTTASSATAELATFLVGRELFGM